MSWKNGLFLLISHVTKNIHFIPLSPSSINTPQHISANMHALHLASISATYVFTLKRWIYKIRDMHLLLCLSKQHSVDSTLSVGVKYIKFSFDLEYVFDKYIFLNNYNIATRCVIGIRFLLRYFYLYKLNVLNTVPFFVTNVYFSLLKT